MLNLKTILSGLKINGFQMRFLNLVHNVSDCMVKALFLELIYAKHYAKHCLQLTEVIGNFLVRGTHSI